MNELTVHDWREVVNFAGELSEVGCARAELAWEHARQGIQKLLGADSSMVVVQHRQATGELDPLCGFRAVFSKTFGPDAERRQRLGRQWAEHEPNVLEDPVLHRQMAGFGEARTLDNYRIVDARTFDRAPLRRLLELQEADARLVTILPLSPAVEITFCFDRMNDSKRFTERDRQRLAALARCLGPLGRSFARSRGLMPGQQTLSPRERDILTYLLGPSSEKEIADRLDLSPAYVHQLVVAVYRKLGVRSRPELMALWLGGRPLAD